MNPYVGRIPDRVLIFPELTSTLCKVPCRQSDLVEGSQLKRDLPSVSLLPSCSLSRSPVRLPPGWLFHHLGDFVIQLQYYATSNVKMLASAFEPFYFALYPMLCILLVSFSLKFLFLSDIPFAESMELHDIIAIRQDTRAG